MINDTDTDGVGSVGNKYIEFYICDTSFDYYKDINHVLIRIVVEIKKNNKNPFCCCCCYI